MTSDLVTARHLRRKAVIYIRQSTPQQVLSNQESLRLQYALHQRARELGWHEADVEVIDADLGRSGATSTLRGRLTAGLLSKAERGELALLLPTGLVRGASGVVAKHPDCEVQERIGL